ncbi:MAG: 2,4-dihydroxyhept-2-ene-1,7-dioic acid aldolase [Planctomycetaceae bacterium]|nr:2,4-dihydroxyhept-2-ene-1,7-dioic acid aldolase [Planctomycetaceae bacterium]
MTHHFRARLKAGERLIGTMATLPTPAAAEILAGVGFDWLFVDGEHGPLGTGDVLGILQAVGDRTPCIVRVPGSEEPMIKRTLDLGATGIIVPQTNTAEQVANVVRYARYAPLGARGVGLGRAHGYGLRFQEYMDKANDEVAVIVQAEHADAVKNIDAIVAVPGIDAILLGPYDLAASLGKMGSIDDPEVTSAIDRVTAACQKVNMPLRIFGVTADAVRPYLERGYTLIVASVDTLFLGTAARSMLSQLR